MLSRTCSSCAACQLTSGQITAQSSSLRLSEIGSRRSEQRLRLSSLGHPGKTATAKASMGGCETNCSTVKSSTRYATLKSSSKAGGNITTPSDHTVHWATAHQRLKPSSRWTKGRSCINFQSGPLKWGCSIENAPPDYWQGDPFSTFTAQAGPLGALFICPDSRARHPAGCRRFHLWALAVAPHHRPPTPPDRQSRGRLRGRV